ncbi:HAMP domain-containing sensor histidine kinase [Paremcibacter congregatus]|uniref:sensor histidine kinase n=1 Tax=Paremcibacter congregatus TaxID=2043170 RepID=UPI0030EDB8E0
MTPGKIWAYRSSLFVQLTVLSCVVLAMLFVQFFILPFWSSEPGGTDAAAFDRNKVSGIIYGEILKKDADLESLLQNKTILRIARLNPKFRFFAETEKSHISFGGPPRRLRLPESIYTLDPRPEASYPCSDFAAGAFPFREAGIVGRVSYNNCPGKAYYIEVAGIETSAFSRGEQLWDFITSLQFVFFESHLLLGGGILLTALLIIFQAVYSLRKLSRVAKEFDPDRKHNVLPETGLPLEVRPLVRALNEMLSRVEEAHEKHNFFLATAAHELRTPLTIMRTRLEDLIDGEIKDQLRDDIRGIATLVEQLLRLTRLKSVEDLSPEPLNLVDVARAVCANRAPLAIEQGLDLQLNTDRDTVPIYGDREMIATAIANLVDNALSISRKGDVISVVVTPDGEVRVRDQGPGVTAERREQIFQPFAKSPPNRPGHGLGLAIVRAVMTLHKGTVDHHNTPGGGSEFTLHFPPSV